MKICEKFEKNLTAAKTGGIIQVSKPTVDWRLHPNLKGDLMKKIVALVSVLSFMATMVFAEPVVLVSEIVQTTFYW